VEPARTDHSTRIGRTGELIERLKSFDGPPEEFLANLLSVQCQVAGAQCGAILRAAGEGKADVLAVHPPPAPDAPAPAWLARAVQAAGEAAGAPKTSVRPMHDQEDLYGQPARRHLVMVPLSGVGGLVGVAAFVVETSEPAALADVQQRLELTVSLLSLYEMRLALQRRQIDSGRLRSAMETVSAVNEHDRFAACGMAFCNELASRYQCDRVGLGFLKGRYVALKALSHTEKFSRKMKLIQDIEAAMEECLDQDLEVLHPPPGEASFVSRAAKELSTRHGPTAVVSFPLRREGEVVAVATLERPVDSPFAPDQIETLRLTCELCTPRLANLHTHDRWFGARAASAGRKALAAVVGPKHTWAKLLAILVLAAIVFLTFVKGEYRAEAPFVIEAVKQRFLPAPFDGYIESVHVTIGEEVEKGQLLAKLETFDLQLQLFQAEAKKKTHETEARAARRDENTAEMLIAQAQADEVAATIRRLKDRIRRAEIRAPIDGTLVTGDLERQIDAPVKTGDILFEIAPLASLRAELAVPESDIAEVKEGMRGQLATTASPDRRLRFVVGRINPVAEVVNQENVFKVRVRLLETDPDMRPGMEGLAKVDIRQEPYGWIWTRRLVNWVRMKLWW